MTIELWDKTGSSIIVLIVVLKPRSL